MVESRLWTARTGAVLLTSILGLGLEDLPAQDATATRGQSTTSPRPRRQRRVPFDMVEGIIGDQVILRSRIEEELRAIEEGGTKLNPRERDKRRQQILLNIAREEIWVQYGKVIGGENPEQLRSMQDRYIAQRMAEQEQRFGSFTRFNEELGNIGESRSALESRFRNQLLSGIGRSSALGQSNRGASLMVTPKSMRRYFDENPEKFSIPSAAEYEWMYFPSNLAEVDAHMAEAAKAWARDGADAKQIAEQHGGRLRPAGRVEDGPGSDLADSIKSFVLGSEPGQVSEPILLGNLYRLYKVTSRTHARDEPFTDPQVQERIRRLLWESQFFATQNRVIQQNSAKLLIWPAKLRSDLTGH